MDAFVRILVALFTPFLITVYFNHKKFLKNSICRLCLVQQGAKLCETMGTGKGKGYYSEKYFSIQQKFNTFFPKEPFSRHTMTLLIIAESLLKSTLTSFLSPKNKKMHL